MHRSETHASFLGATGVSVVRNAQICGANGFKTMRDAPCWAFVETAWRLAEVCN